MALNNTAKWSDYCGEKLFPPLTNLFNRGDFHELIPIIIIALGLAGIITIIVLYASRHHQHSFLEKGLVFYFAISLLIHFNLERFYTHHSEEIYNRINGTESQHPMAKIWRYYGPSDTRWLGQQEGIDRSQYSCMFGLEFMAAYVCGPGCVITLILYCFNNPMRWIMQAVTVTVQAYGLLITWLPPLYEDNRSVCLKNSFEFWGLYLGIQSPWLWVPIAVISQSCYRIYTGKVRGEPKENKKSKSKGKGNKVKKVTKKEEANITEEEEKIAEPQEEEEEKKKKTPTAATTKTTTKKNKGKASGKNGNANTNAKASGKSGGGGGKAKGKGKGGKK